MEFLVWLRFKPKQTSLIRCLSLCSRMLYPLTGGWNRRPFHHAAPGPALYRFTRQCILRIAIALRESGFSMEFYRRGRFVFHCSALFFFAS